MLLYGGPSGSSTDRVAGWVPGLGCRPGVQELLVLLVGSCITVSTCAFQGSRSMTFVSSSKGFPRVGATSVERPVEPAHVFTPGRLCLESQVCWQRAACCQAGHLPALEGQAGVEKPAPHTGVVPAATREWRSVARQPGGRDKLFPGRNSGQAQGVFPPGNGTCPRFWAPPVPLLPLWGTSRGRSS